MGAALCSNSICLTNRQGRISHYSSGARYPFLVIIGAEFSEHQINEWVKDHAGQWDWAGFFVDKIKECAG